MSDGALQDIAHVDVSNFGRGNARLLQGGGDGCCAELRGGDWDKRAIELSESAEFLGNGERKEYSARGSPGGTEDVGISDFAP